MGELAVVYGALPEFLSRHILIAEKTVDNDRFLKIGIELIAVAIVKVYSLDAALFEVTAGKACSLHFDKGKVTVLKAAVAENRTVQKTIAEPAEAEQAVAESHVFQFLRIESLFFKDFLFEVLCKR